MAKKKRTKAQIADPFSPGTVEMLERHARGQHIKKVGKGIPEGPISPFITEPDPQAWIKGGAVHKIEQASKETGVKTDTKKESQDYTRRAHEAQKEAEEYVGLTRGIPKKKKKR